jgi:hypothetical protein
LTENPDAMAIHTITADTRIFFLKTIIIAIMKITDATKYHVPRNAQIAVIAGATIKNIT